MRAADFEARNYRSSAASLPLLVLVFFGLDYGISWASFILDSEILRRESLSLYPFPKKANPLNSQVGISDLSLIFVSTYVVRELKDLFIQTP